MPAYPMNIYPCDHPIMALPLQCYVQQPGCRHQRLFSQDRDNGLLGRPRRPHALMMPSRPPQPIPGKRRALPVLELLALK